LAELDNWHDTLSGPATKKLCERAYHRTVIDSKGKECKKYRYESMMTPYDKFRSLPNAESYLKPGLALLELDKEAMKTNDGEAARLMQQARMKLFKLIHEQKQAS
jgi:hypothetical protein